MDCLIQPKPSDKATNHLDFLEECMVPVFLTCSLPRRSSLSAVLTMSSIIMLASFKAEQKEDNVPK